MVDSHLLVLLLGLIIGSFLNVVIVRLPKGGSILRPPSHCPGCSRRIRWFENIPVVSYLALRGRCPGCKGAISVRYPVVELLTAILFLAAQHRYGLSPVLILRDFPFIAILVAIAFIDLEHRIIPDALSLGGLGLGLLTAWFVPELGLQSSLSGAALGFCLFYALAWFYQRRSGQAGLGGGDIKLLAMLGAFLGPSGVFFTILVSSVLGSVIGLIWAYRTQRNNLLKASIPYGPFLVIGGLYFYLIGDSIWPHFMTPM